MSGPYRELADVPVQPALPRTWRLRAFEPLQRTGPYPITSPRWRVRCASCGLAEGHVHASCLGRRLGRCGQQACPKTTHTHVRCEWCGARDLMATADAPDAREVT